MLQRGLVGDRRLLVVQVARVFVLELFPWLSDSSHERAGSPALRTHVRIVVPPSHAVPVDAVGDQIHPVRTDLGGDPAEIVPIFKRDHRIDLEHQ